MPAGVLPPIQCMECANAGRPDVLMQFMMFEDQWMSVSVADTDSLYRGSDAVRIQRKKVRSAIWRCPFGHRHQQIPE